MVLKKRRRKSIQAEGTVNAKVSVWKQAWHGPETAKSQWLGTEQTKVTKISGEGREELEEGVGAENGPLGQCQDLTFNCKRIWEQLESF